MNKSYIPILKQQFKLDLPGASAQTKMSPIVDSHKYRQPDASHRVACVMALLHPKNEELYVTFIKRAASHPDDKHAGQIGFPGGKYEVEDASLIQCALRETEEEIGVNRNDIEIIGELTSLYVFASNFMVYPFVGYLDYMPQYTPQVEEVADIYELPLKNLVDPKFKISRKVRLAEGFYREAPGYNVNGDFLWGATAMISSELETMVQRMEVLY
ncbi:MAG: CoA pyrophosphatase [Saprospiraceae bacterium]|nr:CoA pyrophosphatase [Saprospiraceae bacterium]